MSLDLASRHFGGFGALNAYWGQNGAGSLSQYCDTGIDYVTLSFVNEAPEHDPSNYPGTNFAAHCWDAYYSTEDGVESDLLSKCQFKSDISYCQSKGVKVLLSIGGEYKPEQGSDYRVTTDENAEYFADFLYKAFGPYDASWDGPRPFDVSETEHTVVDGFDFDIEARLDNGPYITMIEKLRDFDDSLIITGAPQCPTDLLHFYMKELIERAKFDALFIQFYNNHVCDAVRYNDLLGGFNYDDWVDIVANSDHNKDTKLFIGLPSREDASGSGYIPPNEVKDLVCQFKDSPNFGGISIWDLYLGANNEVDGKSFNQHVLDALEYGCGSVPTTTSSTSSASSTAESTTESATTAVSTTAESATSTAETTTEATSTEYSATSTSTFSATTTTGWNVTTTHSVTDGPTTTSATEWTTSTHFETNTITVTDCPPYVVDCPEDGYVTTEVVPVYTTVCPVTDGDSTPEPTGTPDDEDEDCEDEEDGDEDDGDDGDDGDDDQDCHDCPGETIYTTLTSTISKSSSLSTVTKTSAITTLPDTTVVPTGGWTSTGHGPVPTTETPITGGASGLTVGVTGLMAAIALHALFF